MTHRRRAAHAGADDCCVTGGSGARAQLVSDHYRGGHRGGHLQAGGVSPLSFAYFSLRPAKKSRCRPAQGQRQSTTKQARKGQHPKSAPKKPPEANKPSYDEVLFRTGIPNPPSNAASGCLEATLVTPTSATSSALRLEGDGSYGLEKKSSTGACR
jgi:hypothetical protein